MRFLFLVNPIFGFHLDGDTSYALMLEATRRGHDVLTCQPGHLSLDNSEVFAEAQATSVRDGEKTTGAFSVAARARIPFGEIDAVFIRQDPPVNSEYLQTTWLLDRARETTVLINDPRGLRQWNEHLAILDFPEFIPPTLVTRSDDQLRDFMRAQGGTIIVKPVDGFGGLGIFKCTEGDPNLSSLLETATDAGKQWTMAQGYLPAAAAGDKRIVLVDGEPIGAVLRVPPKNENRGNLHVGGTAAKTELTKREREIIEALKPRLLDYGLYLVGLDVIGDMLTEINFTSPTGIRHISRLNGINAAAPVIDSAERKVTAKN